MLQSENVTQTVYQHLVPRGVLRNSKNMVCVHSLMKLSDKRSSKMFACVLMDISQY